MTKIKTKVFIREPRTKEYEPCVECEEYFFLDTIYDKAKKILFHIMREPSWVHMVENHTYEMQFVSSDDNDTYDYRLYKRLNDRIVIVAEYYNDEWYSIRENRISETVCRRSIDDYTITDVPEQREHRESKARIYRGVDDDFSSDDVWEDPDDVE